MNYQNFLTQFFLESAVPDGQVHDLNFSTNNRESISPIGRSPNTISNDKRNRPNTFMDNSGSPFGSMVITHLNYLQL